MVGLRTTIGAAIASHPVVVGLGAGRFLVAWTEAVGDGPLAWKSAPLS